MQQKKIPVRMCAGCGEHFPKKELVRIVHTPQGEVHVDPTGRMAGRGAYLCRKVECLRKAQKAKRLERAFQCPVPDEVMAKLIEIQYDRNDMDFHRGTFRVRGDVLEIIPAYESDTAIRVEFFGDEIDRISEIDILTGEVKDELKHIAIFPASHYVVDRENIKRAVADIEEELEERVKEFKRNDKLLEAQRIAERTNFDIEMLKETGFCSGIENYSRHLSGLKPGQAPYTLIDYFPDDFILFVDESHVTLPQVRAMYNGDHARKKSLVDYGFRLPSAYDNRPLTFDEFTERIHQAIYVSATPAEYERSRAGQIAEQVIRPTGLLDPEVFVRPIEGQIDDLIGEINATTDKGERTLVTTLTKKMAEDLTKYLTENGIRVRYMHSDIGAMERMEIIRDLRMAKFDVLVGINLLREGLDIPECSLVAILDADKEGFLRSTRSLIQTIGRAARNAEGKVILYADKITGSIKQALDETQRRREKQMKYNAENGITPKTIKKSISATLKEMTETDFVKDDTKDIEEIKNVEKKIKEYTKLMKEAAANLEFETAVIYRDKIKELELLAMKNL